MPSLWVVTCKRCGRSGTIADPPTEVNKDKTVSCNYCNQETEVSWGSYRNVQRVVPQEEEDLLDIVEV